MNFLVAPCAYKGTFNPIELCHAIKNGITQVYPDSNITLLPLADGGDGTIESLHFLLGGQLISEEVLGPLESKVKANWLKLIEKEIGKAFSVVELASASGIAHLRDDHLDAMNAHTRGCGQIISRCIKNSITRIFVTVGGSASTDGGMGILTELGVVFKDINGEVLKPCGESLSKVAAVDREGLSRLPENLEITIITDVVNPLYGKNGAAHIYGPQKGASQEQVKILDEGLKNYARVLASACGKKLAQMPGAGAAGGVPFGMATVLSCEIQKGFDWFSKTTDLKVHIGASDCIITGEGYLDSQTLQGKAIGELSRLARLMNKKLWIVPAKYESSIDWKEYAIDRVQATSKNGAATLDDVTEAVVQLLRKS